MPSPALIAAYCLQVAAVAAGVGLTLSVVGRHAPLLRLVSWRAVLAAALLLPLTALLPARATPGAFSVVTGAVSVMTSAPEATPLEMKAAIDWPKWLLVVLGAGAAVRLARLVIAWLMLRRAGRRLPIASCPHFEQLRARLAVDATLVWHDEAPQPFTFGHRPATVVLPSSLASAPAAQLRGILAHELLHVARRDWRWLVSEESVRALLWFHPAVAIAVREIRQAREELVDRATVALTGARRTYLETLVTLAGRPAPAHGVSLAIFESRQLPRRIAALATEASMSRTHLLAASTTVLLAGAIGVSAALHAFPLTPTEQAAQTEAGPLEKQAYVAPRDAPPPVRVHYVAPQVPASAKGIDEVTIDVRLVIDAQGRVAEARGVKGTAAFANPAGVEALGAAVVAAARQWRFEAPAMAPLAVTTTLTFRPDGAAAAKFTSTERPLVVDMKAAVYPEDARTAKVEGDVQAEVTLGPDGGVTDVRVVKTPMPSMGEAAVTALKASTFRPGMKDGVPVPVMITITVRFKLQ